MTRYNGDMTKYAAFLRAVNVGGTNKLPMADLREMCAETGFTKIRTHIASGNVLFTSDETEKAVKAALEKRLCAYAGKPIAVIVRSANELRRILENNPFSSSDPGKTVAIFLNSKPPRDALANATGLSDEKMRIGNREIYVHYGSGMSRSRLRIPASREGTGRNMNTIAKMVELASK